MSNEHIPFPKSISDARGHPHPSFNCSLDYGWCLPLLTLRLDFRGQFIGASAWCPFGACSIQLLDDDKTGALRARHNLDSRNLLGMLQLVARILEIWFVFIATCLVYIVTLVIAGKKDGLPVGCLSLPAEFTELSSLCGARLWTSVVGFPKRSRLLLLAFLVLSALLGLLCNLIGPAIAILALPTLRWSTYDHPGDLQFAQMLSERPISFDTVSMPENLCSAGDVELGRYSCASNHLGVLVDGWAAAQTAMSWQNGDVSALTPITGMTFGINGSPPGNNICLTWVPNRVVIANMTFDRHEMYLIARGDASQTSRQHPLRRSLLLANRSQEVTLLTDGPVLGMLQGIWLSSYAFTPQWLKYTGQRRWIKCDGSYNLKDLAGSPETNYTRCIQVGEGWGAHTMTARLNLATDDIGVSDNVTDIVVNVHASEQAAFLPNGTLPWLPSACLDHNTNVNDTGQSSDCDWDRLFSDKQSPAAVNRSRYHNVMEFTVNHKTGSGFVVAIDFVTLLNFTQYRFDPSTLLNPQQMVLINEAPETGTPIHLHPWWILVAWAVDANGTLHSNHTIHNTLVGGLPP